jgi:carbon-monoxide dehydrogenase large subunit
MDPAELRLKNLIKTEQFPYKSALGWEYDSGNYAPALNKAMETVGYRALREEQKKNRAEFQNGKTRSLMGIGVAFFTEIVGAGPSRNCDILGIAMFDSAEIACIRPARPSPASAPRARARRTRPPMPRSSRPRPAFPADMIAVEEGDTSTAPYGLGTYGSRSTPVAGAAARAPARKIQAKARKIAAHLMEVGEKDVEFDVDRLPGQGSCRRNSRP